MDEWLKVAISILGGGIGVKILDRVLNQNQYQIENEGKVSGQWMIIYSELRKIQTEQQLRIDKLELENEELRLKCISLQHQINFGDTKKPVL